MLNPQTWLLILTLLNEAFALIQRLADLAQKLPPWFLW
jgi:hypothetical protein